MEHIKYSGFSPISIALEQMMNERELRANRSRELTEKYRKTTICMTMNMVGEYKLLPLSYAAFCCFYRLLLKTNPCLYNEIWHKPTGDCAFLVIDTDSSITKKICEKLEDYGEIGRLFDIDVFDEHGIKLSRTEKRKCLICDKAAAECSRNRTHGVDSVRSKCKNILKKYFADEIVPLAKEALIEEVNATPKPGLVDRKNSGANSDMTLDMFLQSADAVSPYFGTMLELSADATSLVDAQFINDLRILGLHAEKAMLSVTHGVNTHKGAIYTIGLLCAGIGYALSGGGTFTDAIDAASQIAMRLSDEIHDDKTHGIEVCRKYGVTGARGEAIGGFKTVLYAFERIKHYADDLRLDTNTAYPLAICDVMSVMNDTNVLHRAGKDGLDFMRKEAREISAMRENQRIDDLYELDTELIKRNISPGGCADALAAAIFLIKAEPLFCYEKID